MTNHELLTDTARQRLLWELWDALLKYLHATLTSGEPVKASMLDVARHFLQSNGITVTSRAAISQGLDRLTDMSALPFNAEGDPNK